MDTQKALEQEINRLESGIRQIMERQVALEAEISRLQAEIAAHKAKEAARVLEEKSARENQKFATFAQHLTKAGVRNHSLKKELDDLLAKVDAYLNQIASGTGQ